MWLPLLVAAWLGTGVAHAAQLPDATGRIVVVPDHIQRVLPADLATAVLLEALAPDKLVGWPAPVPSPARALLADHPAALPEFLVNDVLARANALKPDLVVKYGPVGQQDTDSVRAMAGQLHAPILLLDNNLRETPQTLRLLGNALGQPARGETLAQLAEAMLAMAPPGGSDTRVLFLQGAAGTDAASDAETGFFFARMGWTLVAPPSPHAVTPAAIAKLDPDVIVFDNATMRDVVRAQPAWRNLRAVQQQHAFVAPSLPFGWISHPASINRLLGIAWLSGADPVTAAAMFGAVVYGHAPDARQLAELRQALRPVADRD